MRKIISICFCLLVFIGAKAQKTIPTIKTGSVINASASMGGMDIPVQFTILSLDAPVSIGWSVENYGDGSFEMTAKGMESATELYLVQPTAGKAKLTDKQTFLVISKAAYKAMADSSSFTYNNIKFAVKPSTDVAKINGKETDATHLATADGKSEIWILNNSSFPLIVKTKGLPIDVTVSEVK